MIISYSSELLDVNRKNCYGVTPLHVAAALNNSAVCEMLLRYNADVNSTTNLGYTPFQYAIKYGCPKACRWLFIEIQANFRGREVFHFNQNLNINWQNNYGETALHLAIDSRNAIVMQSEERWPFNVTSDRYTRIVKFLLLAGADVNKQNHNGDTPLHIAASHEMEYIVKLLLDSNADIYLRNKRNKTAMDLTKNNLYPHVKNLLRTNDFYSKGE